MSRRLKIPTERFGRNLYSPLAAGENTEEWDGQNPSDRYNLEASMLFLLL